MESIYINKVVEQLSERRCGNTTRLLDGTVDALFKDQTVYVTEPSYPTLHEFLTKLHNRFIHEHHNLGYMVNDIFAQWNDGRYSNVPYRIVYGKINTADSTSLLGVTISNVPDTSELKNKPLVRLFIQTRKQYDKLINK